MKPQTININSFSTTITKSKFDVKLNLIDSHAPRCRIYNTQKPQKTQNVVKLTKLYEVALQNTLQQDVNCMHFFRDIISRIAINNGDVTHQNTRQSSLQGYK